MADNVVFQSSTPATPPPGTPVATDDVGGVQFQRVKLDVGADGASSPVVGSLPVAVAEPATATLSNATQNVSAVQLLAANAARRGIVIVNEVAAGEAGGNLYVAFAGTASVTVYTNVIPPGGVWERKGGYTGQIFGVWDAAGTGKARITEEA